MCSFQQRQKPFLTSGCLVMGKYKEARWRRHNKWGNGPTLKMHPSQKKVNPSLILKIRWMSMACYLQAVCLTIPVLDHEIRAQVSIPFFKITAWVATRWLPTGNHSTHVPDCRDFSSRLTSIQVRRQLPIKPHSFSWPASLEDLQHAWTKESSAPAFSKLMSHIPSNDLCYLLS